MNAKETRIQKKNTSTTLNQLDTAHGFSKGYGVIWNRKWTHVMCFCRPTRICVHSAAYATARCLSVCLSVRHTGALCQKRLKLSSSNRHFFSQHTQNMYL